MFAALIPVLAPIVGRLIDMIPDPEARAKAEREAMLSLTQGLLDADKAQIGVNVIEAGHRSIFVAGWRPGCAWICTFGLAYSFIIYPTLLWAGAIWFPETPPPPDLDTGELVGILMGLLGLGALRSHDKSKGLTK